MATFISPSKSVLGSSLGTLYVRLSLDTSELASGFKTAEGIMSGSVSAIAGLAKAATGAFIGMVALSLYEYSKFNQAMTQAMAVMGNVSDDLRDKLESQARTISDRTSKSATELAQAYVAMAQAGLDAEQSLKALPAIAQFSIAANIDAAKSTELLVQAQAALGLTSKDAEVNMQNLVRVSDVLARGAVLSTTTMEQLGEALSNKAAAAMRTFNIPMEEGVAVLSAFAEQGLRGSSAGQAFWQVLRDLQRAATDEPEVFKAMGVAVYDAAGNLRNMADIIRDLQKAFATATDEQKRLGLSMLGMQDRSMGATLMLLGMGDAIADYENQLQNASGATDEIANKQMESFINQLKRTWNNIVDVAIEMGKSLAPSVLELAQNIEVLMQWLLKQQKEVGALTAVMWSFVDVLKYVTLAGALVWTTLRSIYNILKAGVMIEIVAFGNAIRAITELMAVWWTALQNLWSGLDKIGLKLSDVGRLFAAVATGNVAAIAAATAQITAENADAFKQITDSMQSAVKDSGRIVRDALSSDWNTAKEQATAAGADITDSWSRLMDFTNVLFPMEEGSKQIAGNLQIVDSAAKSAASSVNDLSKNLSNVATLNSDALAQVINSAELNRTLSSQGFGSLQSQKTGIFRPGSFDNSIIRYNEQTNRIGAQSGLVDRQVSEVQAYNDQAEVVKANLKALQDARFEDAKLTEDAQKRKIAAIEAYNSRLKQLQQAEATILIQSAQNAFGSMADAAEAWAGKQSGVYKAMFAASKAFAIADSIIKIQQGIAEAAAIPWPANLAAIASVVSATANIISTISSVSLAIEGRARGGAVNGNQTYLVGEEGPELFTPRSSGSIIPNKSLGGNVNVVIHNYTDATVSTQTTEDSNGKTLELIIQRVKKDLSSEIRDGRGSVSRALEDSYRLRRGRQ